MNSNSKLQDIAPGKIAAVVTYLEMRTKPGSAHRVLPDGYAFKDMKGDTERYLNLFKLVGAPWLWFFRLALNPAELNAILNDKHVEAYALTHEGRDIGLLEINARRAPDEVEIAYLGLALDYVGKGLGGAMMDFALLRAWSYNPAKVTLQNCSLDHPWGLGFYRKAGFVPVRRAVEISDDPRIIGLLPKTAAPHIPLI